MGQLNEAKLRQDLLTFMREAGQLAIRNQLVAGRHQKADNTLVTETDLAVTEYCKEFFADYFAQADHILIDEESVADLGTPAEVFASGKYHWVLDPIDGTVPYAAGRQGYSISLGILREGKPWLGAIYYPGFGEMIYGDYQEAWHITDAFTNRQVKSPLGINRMSPSTMQPLELGTEILLKYTLRDFSAGLPSVQMASTISFQLVLTGRSTGYVSHCALWDMAAGWPLARAAGMELRWYLSEEKLTEIKPEMLTKRWSLIDDFIVSTPESYQPIKNALILNPNYGEQA